MKRANESDEGSQKEKTIGHKVDRKMQVEGLKERTQWCGVVRT